MEPAPASDSNALIHVRPDSEPRGTDRGMVERRRRLIAKWFVEGYSAPQMRSALARQGVHVAEITVRRDIEIIRKDARDYLSADRFAARDELALIIGRYQETIRQAMFEARRAKDPREKAMFYKLMVDTQGELTDLYERVGFIDQSIGRRLSGTPKDTRIPTGEEIADRVADIANRRTVIEGELVPDAERAWLYGDAAAATSAAQDSEAGSSADRRDQSKA